MSVQLSGPGMKPRFRSNVRIMPSKTAIAKRKVRDKNIAKVAKKVFRSILEHKYFPTESNVGVAIDSAASNTSTFISVCDVPQSAGASSDVTRVGDEISPQSVYLSFLLKAPANGAPTSTGTLVPAEVRASLIRWKGLTSTNPIQSNIMTSLAQFNMALGPFNHDLRSSFNVLWTRTFKLNYFQNQAIVTKLVRLKNSPTIHYVSGSTTSADNRLYLVLSSDIAAGAATGDKPVLAYYNIRLNFLDG